MEIIHNPTWEPRDPSDEDMNVFGSLETGDYFTFFEHPLKPLEVVRIEDHDEFGRVVVGDTERGLQVIYEFDGHLWMNIPDDREAAEEVDNVPFPVEDLKLTDPHPSQVH
jgi:hypothetical protein